MKKKDAIILGIASVITLIGSGLLLIAGVIFYVLSIEGGNRINDDAVILNISEPSGSNHYQHEHIAKVVDGNIVYMNVGSTSCPPVLDNAIYDAEYDRYVLTVKSYEGEACTEDLRAIKQTVSYDGGQTIPGDAEIEIVYKD